MSAFNAEALLTLGSYRFAIDTGAPEEIARTSGYSWPGQDRIGRAPALQFTGKEAETITLRGVIYPHFAGGLRQVDAMRAEADKGRPMYLTTGYGEAMGRWVIERINERRRVFFENGLPRAIEFDLTLKRYD